MNDEEYIIVFENERPYVFRTDQGGEPEDTHLEPKPDMIENSQVPSLVSVSVQCSKLSSRNG